MSTVFQNELNKNTLQEVEKAARLKYANSLSNGSWVSTFKGRDILKRFAGKHASSMTYEMFRNLIIARMKDVGHQPIGMKKIIDQILA
jgi:hypothetical protein